MDATMTVALEWRPQRLESARRKIRGAQKHYFSKRYSMAAHMQETEGTAVAMEDSAAAAESNRLGDALVELETEGIAYGDVSLTIAIHGPLEETEQLDGDVRRIFASHDAKVIREGYGQLPRVFLEDAGATPGPAGPFRVHVGGRGGLPGSDLRPAEGHPDERPSGTTRAGDP